MATTESPVHYRTPRLEDGILITGCGEVWKTETRPDTHTNSGVWKTLHTRPVDDHIRETTLGRLTKAKSGGRDSDKYTRLEDGILITGCGEVWRTETRPDTHTNSGVWKTLRARLAIFFVY